MDKGGGAVGSITVCCQNFFAKNFIGEPFNVSLFPGIEKISTKKGGFCHDFLRIFFVSRYRKYS